MRRFFADAGQRMRGNVEIPGDLVLLLSLPVWPEKNIVLIRKRSINEVSIPEQLYSNFAW